MYRSVSYVRIIARQRSCSVPDDTPITKGNQTLKTLKSEREQKVGVERGLPRLLILIVFYFRTSKKVRNVGMYHLRTISTMAKSRKIERKSNRGDFRFGRRAKNCSRPWVVEITNFDSFLLLNI